MNRKVVFLAPLVLAACGLGLPNGNGGTSGVKRSAITCPKTPAPQTFGQAVCLCHDLQLVGQGFLAKAGQGGAAEVDINGKMEVVGQHQVDGKLSVGTRIEGTGELTVNGDAICQGNVEGVGRAHVTHDLSVGGNLESVGELTVDGSLNVRGDAQSVGQEHIAQLGAYVDPGAPPCDCNNPALPDVAAAIATAKATNDNAASGVPTKIDSVGDAELHFPTGSYYLSSVSTVGTVKFFIDGAVALYVDGDLEAVGDENFTLADGATLDLYVGGQLSSVGDSMLSDVNHPGAVRLYLAKGGNVDLHVGSTEMNALIYAPKATLNVVGDTTIRGGIFADGLSGVGLVTIEYSGVAMPGADVCNPDGTVPGETGTGTGANDHDAGCDADAGVVGDVPNLN